MPTNPALPGTDFNNINSHKNFVDAWLSFMPEPEVAHASVAATSLSTPIIAISTTSESANWTTAPRKDMTAKITSSDGLTLRLYCRVRLVPIAGTFYCDEFDYSDNGAFTILSRTTPIQIGDLITIYERYDIWSVKPFGVFQDRDIAVSANNATPEGVYNVLINGYPGDVKALVANGGTFAIVAAITPLRWPTSAGSTITYQWHYPSGFTSVSGATSDTLHATAPVGSWFIYCDCTDSISGATTTIKRWIRIHSPADPPLAVKILAGNSDIRDRTSRTVKFRLVNARAATIPLGAQCDLWGPATWNFADVVSATHSYTGFINNAPYLHQPQFDEQTLELIGVAGVLNMLNGNPMQWIYTGATSVWTGLPISLQNIFFLIWWLLRWRAANVLTRFNLTLYTMAGGVATRKNINVGQGSIYSQLKALADMYDCNVGSRSDGEIVCTILPSMLNDRTNVVTRATFDNTVYTNLQVTWRQRPAVGYLQYDGYMDSVSPLQYSFGAPGFQNGQESPIKKQSNRIFDGPSDGAIRVGNAFAVENNPYPTITFDLPDHWDIFEPVDGDRIVVDLPADRTPSGAPASINCLVTRVDKQYLGKRAIIKLTCEGETQGLAGVLLPTPPQSSPPPNPIVPPPPSWGNTNSNVPVDTSGKGCLLATNDGHVVRGGWTNISPTDGQRSGLGTGIKLLADPYNYKRLILFGSQGCLVCDDHTASTPQWRFVNLGAGNSVIWAVPYEFDRSNGAWYTIPSGGDTGHVGTYVGGTGWESTCETYLGLGYAHVLIQVTLSSPVHITNVSVTYSRPGSVSNNDFINVDGTSIYNAAASGSSGTISQNCDINNATTVTINFYGDSGIGSCGSARTVIIPKIVIKGDGQSPSGGGGTTGDQIYVGDMTGSIIRQGYFAWLSTDNTDLFFNYTTNYWQNVHSTRIAEYDNSLIYTISPDSLNPGVFYVSAGSTGASTAEVYVTGDYGAHFSTAGGTTLSAKGGCVNVPYCKNGGGKNAGSSPVFAVVLGGALDVLALDGSTASLSTSSTPLGPYSLNSFTQDGKYLTLALKDGSFWVSSNGGTSWSSAANVSGSGDVYGATGSPQNHQFALAFGSSRLAYTADFASTWTNLWSSYSSFASGAFGAGGTIIISAFADLSLLYAAPVTQ